MKFVDRSRVNRPTSLNTVNSPATREFQRAQQHYAGNQKKAYDFKVYKGIDVREALDQLFDKHCAYCESFFGATQPEDIEHFRPKGGVLEDESHPGYWWLASDWDNLLSSCIDCNRRRSHNVLSYDGTSNTITSVQDLVGKGESFPLMSHRATNIGDERHEVPLLICPTSDNPSHFIKFDVIHGYVIVTFVHSNAPLTQLKGEATIRCFGLNRQGLVEKRTKLADKIDLLYVRVEDIFDEAVQEADLQFRKRLIKIGLSQLESIEKEVSAYQEYSVFACEYSKARLERLISKYQNFLALIG